MTASSAADRIRALAEPVVGRHGLVVEDVTLTPMGRRRVLRIVVDLPPERTGGVPMDLVAAASQDISAALDGSSAVGQAPYVLEVSSPGVDRPLVERRHWSRARGRLVTVTVAEGPAVAGRLRQVDDGGITVEGVEPLPWSMVRRGRVEVEFGRPDEPEDPDGAEDLDAEDLDGPEGDGADDAAEED
jgi:ribosome maturation factor RimP